MQNFNPLTMPPAQYQEMRNRAFFLLKKYTSYTYLNYAVELYKGFLKAYEKQLNTPWPNQQRLEDYYRNGFLEPLVSLETGLDLLLRSTHREEAFKSIKDGTKFNDYLLGMSASFQNVVEDPFFIKLGMREHSYGPQLPDGDYPYIPAPYADWVKDALIASDIFCANERTADEYSWPYNLCQGETKETQRSGDYWNFEAFFSSEPSGEDDWPPGQIYPTPIPQAPPHADSDEARASQIWTGKEIPVTGIYEPWFISKGIGCPNYFLAGRTAHQYQMEGTDNLKNVRWRLIWEDKRYVNGVIPMEEQHYLIQPAPPPPITPPHAYPGQPCPRAGKWFSNHLKQTIHVAQGEIMPGPEFSLNGNAVSWIWIE